MALFGLFGPKKSEAQKAYEAVSKKFPSKKVGISDVEAAVHAWEAADGPQTPVWETYFKIAICYDCGFYAELDEAAGRTYHDKVWAKINASGDQALKEWADTFYFWYNQSSINVYRSLSKVTLNLRRLGNALMHVAGTIGDGRMSDFIKDVLYDTKVPTEEWDMVNAFRLYSGYCARESKTSDEMMKDHNVNPEKYRESDLSDVKSFEKNSVKETKRWNKLVGKVLKLSREERNEEIGRLLETDDDKYVFSFQFYHSSPLAFAHVFSNIDNPIEYGLNGVFQTIAGGNTMALHEIAYAAFEDKLVYQTIEKFVEAPYPGLKEYLLHYLLRASEAGDYTAKEIQEKYLP